MRTSWHDGLMLNARLRRVGRHLELANLESDSGSDSGGEPPLEAPQEGTDDVSKCLEKVG